MATDPLGKVLYSCGADSFLKYWDLQTGIQLKVYTFLLLRYISFFLSPINLLLTSYFQSINAHRTAIVSMSITHRLMYTGSQDGTARCWVTEFGDNTVTYAGHTMSVTVIKFYKGLGN